MSEPEDPLGGEVSVGAQLDERGFSAKAKSRTIAAFDRLCGSAIDALGAKVERSSQLTRTQTEVQKELVRLDGERAKERLLASPTLGDRAIEVFLAEQSRKQQNREAVAQASVHALKELPPPEPGVRDPESIDEDWMNYFSAFAEKASSDHLRDLWGRILAGEIRRPKSFSLSTLRMISELDKEIAEAFQEHMKTRLSAGMLPKPIKRVGKLLLDLTFLQEVGLLEEVSGSLGLTLQAREDGYVHYQEGGHLLRARPKGGGKELRLEVIRITRVAREIAQILPREAAEVSLGAIADQWRDECDTIEIGQIERGGVQTWRTL